MLSHLEIRDLLIIDHLALDFRPGLNVLTGETGAGKSILLDALGFVLGWRGRAEVVRAGADRGEVTAVFTLGPGHPAHAVLAEADLPSGEELILRRIATPEGRKSAYVNDRRAGGEVLRALADTLVELHGQQDDRGLLDPRGHRALLDAFGGLQEPTGAVRAAWAARARAAAALSAAEDEMARLGAEEDYLRHMSGELEALAPEPGEDAALDIRRRAMQAAAQIRDDVGRAGGALDGAEGLLSDARRWLDGVADRAEGALDEPLAALERALTELGTAQDGVVRAAEAMAFDPGEIEAVEERLFAIRGLARKHSVAPDDLAALAGDLAGRLARLDAGGADLKRLRSDRDRAGAEYDAAAARLTARRAGAARALDTAMAAELAPLRLDRAAFATVLSAADPGPAGRDTVTFTVATTPGAPPGPLSRVASGGEMSRFLLALKVCLTAEDRDRTLIFDEIDRGVGGATADAVGRRLAALAADAQVLVVTHSPQVAARGAHHWRVDKRIEGDTTTSRVVALDPEGRLDEIARMLAGDRVTDAARGAARSLLAG